MRLVDLSEWQRLRVFEKPNLARGTRIVGGVGLGLATVATAGFVAAPAIGGAIGAATAGYSGAAATSYGLAFLGGGAVAAGGLGVAGGTAVITVVGGALGGSLGAKAMNDYVGEDQSFRIEKVKDGPGTPVIFASGFLSDRVDTWGGWKPMIERRYPNSSVYRVHWGAKELADLWNLTMQGGFKAAASKSVTALARKATASASRLVAPAGAVLAGLDVLTNPWFTAKSRAAKTAVALSDLIARTDEPAYILVGHSLGARVMVLTAALLATKREAPHIADMHLLGAAVAASIDKRPLNDAVGGTVHNYYSRRDNVLRILYRAAELGETPAGSQGFNSAYPRITDHDVSTLVSDHFSYLRAVTLR